MTEPTDGNPLTSFGANEWLVDEMYERYQKDPTSVDPAWGDYFKSRGNGSTPTVTETKAAPAAPAPAAAAPAQAAPTEPKPAPTPVAKPSAAPTPESFIEFFR